MNFRKTAKPTVLVQVQDRAVSAIECKQTKKGIKCIAESSLRLDPGIIEKGRLQKPAKLQAALEELLSSPHDGVFSAGTAKLILPEQLFSYHIAHIGNGQNLTSKELMRDRLISSLYPEKDAWNISSRVDTTHDRYRFGFRGIQEDDLQSYTKAFSSIRLPVEQYLSPSEAVRHFYYQDGLPSEMVLWIWVGEHQSELALFDIYGTYQAHTMQYGMDDLQELVQKEIQIPKQSIQLLMREVGGRSVDHGLVRSFQVELGKWITAYMKESRQLSTYAKSICGHEPSLLLCGKGAHIPHVTEIFSSVLQLPYRSQRSWVSFEGKKQMDDYYHLAPLLGAFLH